MCHHNFDFIRAHTIRTYIHTYVQCSPPLQNVKCYSRGGQGLSPHRRHEKSTLLSITTGEKSDTQTH